MSSLSEKTKIQLGLALIIGGPLAGVIYAAAVMSTRVAAQQEDISELRSGYIDIQKTQILSLQTIQKDIADIKERQSANAADITATVKALGDRVDRIGIYLRETKR